MTARLPARLEVDAIMRRAEGAGGFATILHRGDPDRGAVSLVICERGQAIAVLERRMAADFAYHWTEVPGTAALSGGNWRNWVAEKSRIDPDCWLVELDIADAQRFVAETTLVG